MLDSGVLDVAIGVILVYFLLSFLGSAINEFIAARMRLRAKDLEDGIRLLLGSQTTTAPGAKDVAHLIRFWGNAIKGLWRVPMSLLFGSSNGSGKRSGGAAGELFNHPLLRTLKHNGKLPSYVPARTFSAALLDVERIARNPDLLWEAVSEQVAESASTELRQYLGAVLSLPRMDAIQSYIDLLPAGALKQQIEGYRDSTVEAIRTASMDETLDQDLRRHLDALVNPNTLQSALIRVQSLPDSVPYKGEALALLTSWSDLVQSVESLTQGVAVDINAKREELEKWFDQGMDRVSGWYRRRAQVIIVVIAIPIVAALNADTITMAQTLWQDAAVRDAVVSEAVDLVNQERAPACYVAADTGEEPEPAQSVQPEDCIDQVRTQLKGLEMLGWRSSDDTRSDPREHPAFDLSGDGEIDYVGWLLKFAGLGITVGAVSQGASFWFDFLKKAINVRGSGKAPPSTTDPK